MHPSRHILRAFAAAALALSVTASFAAGCGDDTTYFRCFPWPDAPGDDPNVCPSQDRATQIIARDNPNPFTVIDDGILEDGKCCYEVLEEAPGDGCPDFFPF
ncbi:hypothetical protein [Polyangium sp. y55x31]|uniref:hypothetical protein n=1 Tax=Polyangium sp. y55x31 TaxID=3042688 RepID=UPI00248313BE|nr:hypothetical protein [Polyangium sp. y55x31]MDI1482046.1 hypothetical protein [Polyangium sp. y55x31]